MRDLWGGGGQIYSVIQIANVINSIGIDVVSETNNDFLVNCPYHYSKYDPSMTISKERGVFFCFNPACNMSGDLIKLVSDVNSIDHYGAIRLIHKYKTDIDIIETLTKSLDQKFEFQAFSQETLDVLKENYNENRIAQEYMESRSFSDETCNYFNIGYSEKTQMICVPMYSIDKIPLGIIGRSINGKKFKNSGGLPTSKTLWNINSARLYSSTVIIAEASFDAMRIHQAGYPNAVAILGGNFSKFHIEQINRNFTEVIIMTDYDDKTKYIKDYCGVCENECIGHNPGRELGRKIMSKLSGKKIRWACYGETVYPHGAKDAGDMTDEEISLCIKNAISPVEYSLLGFD